ncbi:PaaI family thioesterase [Streptomyces sp. NPDC101165]|uniref:PaaI family thioesterase n=1 Tax=Streptomyces sp. NPDC101165 TaxID=3366119 RepID=UPI0037FAF2AA
MGSERLAAGGPGTAATAPARGSMLSAPAELAGEQLAARMGIEVVSAEPGRVVATMPVRGNMQPYGWLHGGANAVLAETLGSVAASLWVAPRGAVAGLELSCTHHRSARSGLVTGVCTPLHLGSRVATYQIEITDDKERPTCTARLTCLVHKR